MFSKFIRRPVFAIVISVVIIFVGILAIKKLPVSQFPDIYRLSRSERRCIGKINADYFGTGH